MKKHFLATLIACLLPLGVYAAQQTITVGTSETPHSLDTNFGNIESNFDELYTEDVRLEADKLDKSVVGDSMIEWPAAISATEVEHLNGLSDTLVNLLAAKANNIGNSFVGNLSDYKLLSGSAIAATAGTEGETYRIESVGTTTTWATCGSSSEDQYTTFEYGSTDCVGDGTMYLVNNLFTVQSVAPTSASDEGFYGATATGHLYWKTDAGLFTITGTYAAD